MDKLKELLKQQLGDSYTDDLDAKVDEVLEEHVQAAVESETTKLRKNNERLTKQLKDARAGQGAGDTSELEEKIETLEQENTQLKKQTEKLQKAYDKDTKQLTEKLESERSSNHTMLVDNGLAAQLDKANIAPAYKRAAQRLLRDQVQVVEENGERKAVATVDADGKRQTVSLDEFVQQWAQSDEGKAFVKAPANSGGGAEGNNGTSSTGKTVPRSQFDQMNDADRMAFVKDGGKVVNE